MKGALTYITLAVRDMDASVKFYRAIFLWPEPSPKSAARFFQLPNLTVALMEQGRFTDFVGEGGEPGSAGLLLSWNVGSETAVDALVQRARTMNAALERRPSRLSWGGYAGILRTPDGHLWEIVWNPRLQNPGQKIICEPGGPV